MVHIFIYLKPFLTDDGQGTAMGLVESATITNEGKFAFINFALKDNKIRLTHRRLPTYMTLLSDDTLIL